MMQPIIEPKPYPISFSRFRRFILGKVHPRTMNKGSTISVGLISLICLVLIFVSTTDKMFKENTVASSCKAASLVGKYQTVSSDDDILDQMYSVLVYSKEHKEASRDKSTIIEYSNDGSGTYHTAISSSKLTTKKTKTYQLGVPFQEDRLGNRKVTLVYTCEGDDLVLTETYPDGRVLAQRRHAEDENGETVHVIYSLEDLVAKRVLKKVE